MALSTSEFPHPDKIEAARKMAGANAARRRRAIVRREQKERYAEVQKKNGFEVELPNGNDPASRRERTREIAKHGSIIKSGRLVVEDKARDDIDYQELFVDGVPRTDSDLESGEEVVIYADPGMDSESVSEIIDQKYGLPPAELPSTDAVSLDFVAEKIEERRVSSASETSVWMDYGLTRQDN